MSATRVTHPLRLVAAMAVLALLAAACGLKPEGEAAIGFAPRDDVGGDAAFADPAFADPAFGVDDGVADGTDVAAADGSGNGGTSSPGTSSASAAPSPRASSATGSGASSSGGTSSGGSGAGSSGTGGSGTGGSGAGGSGAGGSGSSGTGSGGSGGGSSGSGNGGGTPAAGNTPSGEGQTPAGGGGGAAISGSDRTGVDAEAGSINVAIHAPVTGAAPLPVNSFEQARDLYFRHALEEQGDIGGFTQFNISFADDRYQPSTAVQACRQLAADNFLLVGGGGTDQIQACGRFADQSGIPYFSAGVTETGLAGLRNYFASSMSYRAQGVLLAQYVAANFGDQKVAAIVTDTENFGDAVAGWEQGVQASGLNYYRTLRHPKGDTSWYNTFALELAQNDVDIVYINSSPVDYLRFAQQATGQGYQPQYVGVGVTMGLNALLGSGCGDGAPVDGGIFFSPFPGLDWARDNEPEFFAAANRFGTPSDDIALALWAQGKILAQLLERYQETYGSNDVTREDFRDLVETAQLSTGVFPDLAFSPEDHFGADTVHVLQADCASGEHRTLATFASGF